MNPENLRQITKEEYHLLIAEMRGTAQKMAAARLKEGWAIHSGFGYEWFYDVDMVESLPCLYQVPGDGINYINNPITDKKVRQRNLPKKFKHLLLDSVQVSHHLTLDGCPLIKPFESMLQCAYIQEIGGQPTYWTCEHRAGECPAKEER